jgi:hypothetical protein
MRKKLMQMALGAATAFATFGTTVAVKAADDLSISPPANRNLNPTGNADGNSIISTLGNRVIDIVFLISGILAVVYLLWSGIQYITAGGNADKVKAARQGIVNAVIGIVIIFAAFMIVRFAVGVGRTVENADNTVMNSSAYVRMV